MTLSGTATMIRGLSYSALAQSVEQLTVNQWVAGSSPAGGAKKRKGVTSVTPFFISFSSNPALEPAALDVIYPPGTA